MFSPKYLTKIYNYYDYNKREAKIGQ